MTYSNAMAMSRRQFGGRGKNTINQSRGQKKLGPISNTVILVVLTCLLGLLYLTQVTKTNAYGYKINGLQDRQAQLKQEHDELEVAAARLQALERVKTSAVAKSLVSVAPAATVRN